MIHEIISKNWLSKCDLIQIHNLIFLKCKISYTFEANNLYFGFIKHILSTIYFSSFEYSVNRFDYYLKFNFIHRPITYS